MLQRNIAFCSDPQHDDYMIRYLNVNIANDQVIRSCRQCRQPDYYNQIQQQFNEEQQLQSEIIIAALSNIDSNQLKSEFHKKIDQHFERVKPYIKDQMNHYVDQFIQLKNILLPFSLENNSVQLEGYLNQQKEAIIQETAAIKNQIINHIYSTADDLKQILFPRNLSNDELDKQTISIPEIQKIVNNCDSYNLLLKFELIYLEKLRFFDQTNINSVLPNRVGELLNEIVEIQPQIQGRTDIEIFNRYVGQQQEKINQQRLTLIRELKNQSEILINRFNNQINFQEQYLQQIQQFLEFANNNNNQEIQIQALQDSELIEILKFQQISQYLKQILKEQIYAYSNMRHLGQLDVGISLDEIKTTFLVENIPMIQIQSQQTALIPRLALQNRQQMVEYQDRELFNLDLRRILNRQTNQFNYTCRNSYQKYSENNNVWQFYQNIQQNGEEQYWTLEIPALSIKFEKIKLNDNEIDLNRQIIYTRQDKQICYKYEGNVDNSLQFQGQGKLIITNQIKQQVQVYSGVWENGKLNGEGRIEINNILFYEGEFVDGQRNGFGIEYFPQNYFYKGQFVNDKKQGGGEIYKYHQSNNGRVTTKVGNCEWRDDQPVLKEDCFYCSIF